MIFSNRDRICPRLRGSLRFLLIVEGVGAVVDVHRNDSFDIPKDCQVGSSR